MSNLSKDNKDNTVDEELQLKNFEHAGEILAELWSKLVFSDHLVVAEFVGEDPSDTTITKLEEWKANHVHESPYFLQTVKCTDTASCSPFQSSYLKIMKDRFLPPRIHAVCSSTGIEWAKDDKKPTYLSLFQNVALKGNLFPKHVSTKFPRGIPYDYSCPTMKDAPIERVCKHCSLYFGSIKSKQDYSQNCR